MNGVLVDTSVWRRYFSGAAAARGLGDLLDEDGAVFCHAFVLGELVLGGMSSREEELFTRLPTVAVVPDSEVLAFVQRRRLARRGIGWVDAHLLASALAASVSLWSLDAALADVARELDVAFR